jgi:hypothetical protein
MSDLAQGTIWRQTISAAFVTVAQVHSINYSSTRDDNDVSHLSGGVQRDFLPGLIDPGTVEIAYRFDPNGATQQDITDQYILTTTNPCKIVWSDNTEFPLTTYVKGVSYSAAVGGVLEGTATYKVADAAAFPT